MDKNIKNQLYFPPAVTTDVVIFTIEDNELRVLLIKRTEDAFKGKWALPGGFVQKDETTMDAALRVLKNKAGVGNVYIEQLYTFDSPKRDPRGHVLSVAYFALVPRNKISFDDSRDRQTPTLVSVRQLPQLAFDHKEIIDYAIKRIKYKFEYTNIAFSLLPLKFTFSELQSVYEIVLGTKLDKRNFRKKIMSLGIIKPTKEKKKGGKQRPAELYKFVSRKPSELKRFF